ncbi:MAG: GNAT family N-acetyltransferase [Actinobacteria bacterium]|nr:GNAT family N-acetyltransferase [Actinomycetota bacterium]
MSPAELARGFLRYLFDTWRLRRVYAEVAEFNLHQFGRATSLFGVEGRRREYVWLGGRFWDRVILGLSRERFEHERFRVGRAISGKVGAPSDRPAAGRARPAPPTVGDVRAYVESAAAEAHHA